LVSAGGAIYLCWRRRGKWEPSEEDIPKGAERVAGLLNAVVLGLIWSLLADSSHIDLLTYMAMILAVSCLIFLLVYGFLVSVYTYDKVESVSPKKTVTQRIIGGLRVTSEARRVAKKNRITTQEVLKGAAYDVDKVWTRSSRALAKLLFVVCYIGLVVCGTIALTCVAIITLVTGKA
jgi:hypothetical protein